MKTLKILPVLFMPFFFSAYAQEKAEIKKMLDNPQTQEAIFQSILSDSSLTAKFMDKMMLQASKNPEVCHQMCSSMMGDEHMANAIAERILELQKKKEAGSLEEGKKKHQTFHTAPGKN